MGDSQSDSKIFSVRIVSIDHYMAPPIPGMDFCYSSFQGGKVNEVPVIRIYGATPVGQKTCLHIHRALPYLYIPCSDLLLQADQEGDAFTQILSLAIEKALKLKGNAGSKRQHVHGCSLVRARKFYGYHPSEELFVKIYFYFPQDVSRAANLLLGGAVLDKILQPHESHVPFLLQFLVDYNLFGMGHLHLAKMKFRHPVPDVFCPRKCKGNRHQSDIFTAVSVQFQSDPTNDTCPGSPIWISSTIPDGWIWQCSSQLDPLTDQSIPLVRRQSICELEADASVDDIINQQSKLYSSLSQTRSEVNMIQSLIPIWEEEFQRTGILEAVLPSDSGKPRLEDVLSTLSDGLEFQNKLMKLCSEAEKISSCSPSKNDVTLVGLGHVDPQSKGRDAVRCSKASDSIGFVLSEDMPLQDDNGATSEVRDIWPKQLSADELQTSDTIEPSDMKTSDQEALRLLKWLASSQAAEDINSDDELVHEAILSPLLPAATIDKVLEKANRDYETESQQECQDILDSVEDLIKYEGLKGKTSCSLSRKIIPQVDGSGDDQTFDSAAGNSSFKMINNETEKSLKNQAHHDISSKFTCKRKGPLWGSLPIFSTQSVNDNSQASNFDITGRCDLEMKEEIGSCSWIESEANACPNVLIGDTDRDFCTRKERKTLLGSSVRDLMRKKRCYKAESSGFGTPEVREVPSDEQRNDRQENSIIFSPNSKASGTNKQTELQKRYIFSSELHGFGIPEVREAPSEEKRNDGQENRFSPISKFLYTNERTEFKKRNISSSASLMEMYDGAYHVNSNQPNSSVYNNSPVFSKRDSLLSGSMYHDTGFHSCHEIDGKVVIRSIAGSRNLGSTGSPMLNKGNGELSHFLNSGSTDLSICPAETETSYKDGCLCRNGHERKNFIQKAPDISSENEFEVGDGNIIMFPENLSGTLSERDTGLLVHGSPESIVVNSEMDPAELIGLTFCRRPPIIESGGTLACASTSPGIPDGPCPCNAENHEETSVRSRDANQCLPFFAGDCLEKKGVQINKALHQDIVMGVPTHYQNDGSYLFMLTPVFSPPSVESVYKWLLVDGIDISKETLHSVSTEPSSPVGSHGNLINSQCSPINFHNEPLLEFGSESDVKPNVDQKIQQDEGKPNAQKNSSHDHAILNKGNIFEVKQLIASHDLSQLSGPEGKSKLTPLSQIGFRDPASVGDGQQLTLLSIEVHAESRVDLQPDPRFDAVNVIVLVFQEDDDSGVDAYVLLRCNIESGQRNLDGISGLRLFISSEERDLFIHFMKIIHSSDPDIIMGWDIQGGSLGFLAERAALLGIGLLDRISRTPSEASASSSGLEVSQKGLLNDVLSEPSVADPNLEDTIIGDEWGRTHASGLHVGGRIVLNIWRLMRSEVKLNMYTAEAVAEAVLRRKIPSIHCKVLTNWFSSGPGRGRYRCIEYVLERAKLNLQIMNQLDMINRTSELARVFGIDFFSVLSRGSQYRVESMFLRLAHTQNYLAISPGNQQVASQPAMECLPLVMEPESGFYSDPVVVLDFQSLYPSMIIAYNLCFCTCLGKITPPKAHTLGVSSYSPDLNVLKSLKQEILITPNGVMYMPSKVRKGVLPRLLEEILSTRIMVKQAMKKLVSSQQVLHRIFNARQLALKLIANVTYGYTAAGFSGRMPCAELADSIVQCGRRTLENAILLVNTNDKWKAKVIYGDTDSMFVLLKGCSLKESFQIGREIAAAVTAMNPNPVTLKMEKVYHPCFLLTKKRYVGYSYESPDQLKPVFDAKGIETVRRDTCGAVSKIMEQSLRLFFEHPDINQVKDYVLRQWTRILSGRVSLQDFIFAKEVRLGTYSVRASSLPPAAIVATKAMRVDPRAAPRYAERIPYVVVHGEPGARLVDLVVDPLDLLAIDSPFRLNDIYYIRKQMIPVLQRVFGLVGADLNQWFSDMPRPGREAVGKRKFYFYASNPHQTRIDYYYISKHCIVCGDLVKESVHFCGTCSKNEVTAATVLTGRTSKLEREIQHLTSICRQCGGGDWLVESGVKCTSLACSVFFERRKVQRELQSLSAVAAKEGFYPQCMVEWF